VEKNLEEQALIETEENFSSISRKFSKRVIFTILKLEDLIAKLK